MQRVPPNVTAAVAADRARRDREVKQERIAANLAKVERALAEWGQPGAAKVLVSRETLLDMQRMLREELARLRR